MWQGKYAAARPLSWATNVEPLSGAAGMVVPPISPSCREVEGRATYPGGPYCVK